MNVVQSFSLAQLLEVQAMPLTLSSLPWTADDATQGSDRYRMLLRLQIAAFVGCVFIILYSVQFHSTSIAVRIASVGILIAGASLFVGFLLGFIFCIPRTAKPTEALAAATSHGTGTPGTSNDGVDRESTAIAASVVETNTNLVDISDWLTKILVGVGLVELNKIPQSLRALCTFLAPGLRPEPTEAANSFANSEAFALGIVLFFFGVGFLIGYLWTRLYFQRALAELADLPRRRDKAWQDATNADVLMDEDKLDEAIRVVDGAIKANPSNAKALLTKGRILKRLAQVGGKPGDKALLQEALSYALRASALEPNKGSPLYNVACYQALLGVEKADVLKNLKRAFELFPKLRADASKDDDLVSLWEDADFKELTGNP
jgi:hypothetical protein